MLGDQHAAWSDRSLRTDSTATALDSDNAMAPVGMVLCGGKGTAGSTTGDRARLTAITLQHVVD